MKKFLYFLSIAFLCHLSNTYAQEKSYYGIVMYGIRTQGGQDYAYVSEPMKVNKYYEKMPGVLVAGTSKFYYIREGLRKDFDVKLLIQEGIKDQSDYKEGCSIGFDFYGSFDFDGANGIGCPGCLWEYDDAVSVMNYQIYKESHYDADIKIILIK